LTSTVVHLVLLLLLAAGSVLHSRHYGLEGRGTVAETGTIESAAAKPEQLDGFVPPVAASDSSDALAENRMEEAQAEAALKREIADSDPADSEPADSPDSNVSGELRLGDVSQTNSFGSGGDFNAQALSYRSNAEIRDELLASGGGTPASEAAVGKALAWLAEHQNADGSWSIDHRTAPRCAGRCGDPGERPKATLAATALALLPFLGAGETHQHGKYQNTVDAGLRFLVGSMHVEADRGSLLEPGGNMYGHGMASIVLCEAYGMTRDPWLREPAQQTINYIVWAQDPQGGGWRYEPQQPGDTTVLGWQVMALKSAHMAYLHVPAETIRKAGLFLDSVQTGEGAFYGYMAASVDGTAASSAGVLCRMYMGWRRDHPALQRAIADVVDMGPSLDQTGPPASPAKRRRERMRGQPVEPGPPRNDLYYNYYAIQVMRHYGGPDWPSWNAALRDYLIRTQVDQGHARGSWHFEGVDIGLKAGGRLYSTALSTMILEVYYRYLPLYTDRSTKDKFQN
jgi:hypothetical protein